jgi:hypothetical protein
MYRSGQRVAWMRYSPTDDASCAVVEVVDSFGGAVASFGNLQHLSKQRKGFNQEKEKLKSV